MSNRKIVSMHALHTMQRVMLKRISKGYSAEELSFLIGCKSDFVAAVEGLKVVGYTCKDIRRIAKALEERDLCSFFNPLDEEVLAEVQMEHIEEGGVLVHRCTLYSLGVHRVILLLNEPVLENQQPIGGNSSGFDMAMEGLKLLLNSGYFSIARTNQQIFKRINRFLGAGSIRPYELEQAMSALSTGDDAVFKYIST